MLKAFILTASIALSGLLLSSAVLAEPSVAANAAEATQLLSEKCTQGCMVLSPSDVAELEAAVNGFAQRAYAAGAEMGYEKGTEDLAAAAVKNPKICPKNI